MYQSAEMAQIFDKVNTLPLKFNTKVGSNLIFSGGEVQRLMLARAFYKSSEILILDEATSNLDKNIEYKIYDEIHKINSTIISVAHSEETLKVADSIYELIDGNLIKK